MTHSCSSRQTQAIDRIKLSICSVLWMCAGGERERRGEETSGLDYLLAHSYKCARGWERERGERGEKRRDIKEAYMHGGHPTSQAHLKNCHKGGHILSTTSNYLRIEGICLKGFSQQKSASWHQRSQLNVKQPLVFPNWIYKNTPAWIKAKIE